VRLFTMYSTKTSHARRDRKGLTETNLRMGAPAALLLAEVFAVPQLD
jgi:hypothetical protein